MQDYGWRRDDDEQRVMMTNDGDGTAAVRIMSGDGAAARRMRLSEHFGTLRIEGAFHRSFSDRDFCAGVISDHFGAAFCRQHGP